MRVCLNLMFLKLVIKHLLLLFICLILMICCILDLDTKLVSLGNASKTNFFPNNKFETCIVSKYSRKPFPNVNRTTSIEFNTF